MANLNGKMLALSDLRRAESEFRDADTELKDAARAFVYANPDGAEVAAAMGEAYDRRMAEADLRLAAAAVRFASALLGVDMAREAALRRGGG